MDFELPSRGIVFWPVGCGDATTVVVDENTVIQVDLNHLEAADDDDDPRISVIDELVQHLPEAEGGPYLSVFSLTHMDADHCRGFEELLDRTTIGEIWAGAPSLEADDSLCDDAKAMHDELLRRLAAARSGSYVAGDRLRIIGPDDDLTAYSDLPGDMLNRPGDEITEIDEADRSSQLRVHLLAPMHATIGTDRNDRGLAMQVNLSSEQGVAAKVVLLGDRSYDGVAAVFDESEPEDVAWNVFLAPHHCSRSVFYSAPDPDSDPVFRQDIVDSIEGAASSPGFVVASSSAIPSSNSPGDNPPHAEARELYEELAPDGFFCTGEHPDEAHPEPIVFEFDSEGIVLRGMSSTNASDRQAVTEAVVAARGANQPPKETVGFGE